MRPFNIQPVATPPRGEMTPVVRQLLAAAPWALVAIFALALLVR